MLNIQYAHNFTYYVVGKRKGVAYITNQLSSLLFVTLLSLSVRVIASRLID